MISKIGTDIGFWRRTEIKGQVVALSIYDEAHEAPSFVLLKEAGSKIWREMETAEIQKIAEDLKETQ